MGIEKGLTQGAKSVQDGLKIAVMGREGVSAELVRVADVVVCDIRDAPDLIINPLRLKALCGINQRIDRQPLFDSQE